MSTEMNKALMQRHWAEHWNQGNLASIDEIYAADFVGHGATGDTCGVEGVQSMITAFRTAFPDLHCTVEEMIATGDKVITRWTLSGTQQATFMELPAMGKAITLSGISINRFANGKTVEAWDEVNIFGMLQQLGVL